MNKLSSFGLGADEIRSLFDIVIAKLKKLRGEHFRDRQIFFEVLGEKPETHEVFVKFLSDVTTCPLEVIQWCQDKINVKAEKMS
jgi:hypothetical protein